MTAPDSPQQNEIVERRNRALMEMTRSLLKHVSLPNHLWGEVVRHATYLINRVGIKALIDQTPYEGLKGRKPTIEHLRIFGCKCYAKIEKPFPMKLDDMSRTLIHLGIDSGSKAYRLYHPISQRVVVSRDVVFDEKKTWEWTSSSSEAQKDEPGTLTITYEEYGNRGVREYEDKEETEHKSDGVIEEESAAHILPDDSA